MQSIQYGKHSKASWLHSSLFSISVIIALLILASCGESSETAQTAPKAPAPTAATAMPTTVSTPTSSATPTNDGGTAGDQLRDQMVTLHALNGPDGWAWRTSIPEHRLVVFYGNPLSPEMGPLGQYSDDDLIAKLHEQAQVYANLDPAHPVVPALDYVTPVVQPVPMDDNTWTYRMPNDSVAHYVDVANTNHALFFFDMQIGHSTVQHEVNLVMPFLERPGVDLALDPEFDMPPGAIPDQVFGRMHASEINWAIDTLSNLVVTKHLPPKILIIHQFREDMLPDWQNIKLKPGVEVVTCVDGFGPPGEKIDDYQIFDKQQLIQYPGMKLFYTLDKPLMSASDVIGLDPSPLMVMYQ